MHLYGVNVFFSDGWAVVDVLRGWYSGTLSLPEFFDRSQYNEHRYFFPYVTMLVLGSVTRFNAISEMYLIQGCIIVSLVTIFVVFRDSIGNRAMLLAPLFIPISLLLFSLRQYENMLWGNQITFAFVQVFSVLAFYFIYTSGKGTFWKVSFTAALMSATVATYSAAQGLVVWPVGLGQIFLLPIESFKKKVMIGLWSLAGVVEWVVYFAGYECERCNDSLGTKATDLLLSQPVSGIKYFLTLLGSSLFWQADMALIGGSLILCLILGSSILLLKGKQNSFWLALVLFSLLALASTTLGRSDVPAVWAQATAPRYATFSILAVVGVYAMLTELMLVRKSQVIASSAGMLLGLVLLSTPLSYLNGFENGAAREKTLERVAHVAATYESQPDERLRQLYPSAPPSVTRDHLRFLDKNNYNVFDSKER